MSYSEDYFRAANGKIHFYRVWEPAQVQKTLVCLHGIGTSSWRFLELGEYLSARGVKVYAPDLRGYGNNEGRKAYVKSFDEYIRDWEVFQRDVLYRDGVKENYLLGDSMGGLIALYIAISRPEGLQKAILTSPALRQRVKVSNFILFMAKAAMIFAPGAHFKVPIYPQDILRDKKYIEKWKKCTLETRFVTPALYNAMIRTEAEVWRRVKELKIPAVIIQAQNDTIVAPEAAEEFASLSANCKVHVWPGALHAFINDLEREKVYDFILEQMG